MYKIILEKIIMLLFERISAKKGMLLYGCFELYIININLLCPK